MNPITGAALLKLIPQKPPFVMINTLVYADETNCTTTFIVEESNVLVDNGKLNSSGLIENIAQTSAAMNGYANGGAANGYIGDIRSFSYTELPSIGEEITTELAIENRIFDFIIIRAKVKLNEKEIASCQMKIFSPAPKRGTE